MYLQFPQKPEKLTRAEQSLLEFVEGSREEFLFMTIGQLARRTGISEATIPDLSDIWDVGISNS